MRKAITILFTVGVVAVGIMYTLVLVEKDSRNSSRRAITVAEYGEYPLYTLLYLADAKGYFTDAGLDVTIFSAGGDEKVFAALVAGNAQFGVSDPTFTAIAGERGQPGRVVSSILQGVPAFGIAIDPKVPDIKFPHDLAGFSVGTFPAPSTSFTLQERLHKLGKIGSPIAQIAYGALLPALESGRVEIALENEPTVSLAVAHGARRVYSMQEYYPEYAFTGLMVLPSFMEKNPGVVQSMVDAMQRAMNSLHREPSIAVDVLAKRFPELPKEVLASSISRVLESNIFPSTGTVTRKAWDTAIGVRRELGTVTTEARYEEYVINRFAEDAAVRFKERQ